MENKKRPIKKYIFIGLVVLLVAGLTALPFALDKMNADANDGASIHSAAVERADISRTVSGAGTLGAKDSTALSVPEGVVLTGYAVKDSDLVKKGDTVAYVDRVSVYKTASELSDALETVTEELAELQKSAGELQTVYSSVLGKVTKVYAERGSDIAQLMRDYGAIAEITLDDGTVLKLTGTSGIVSYFYFGEGTTVYVNAPIYAYTDVEGTGAYAALVKKHQKIEEQLAQLFQMYRDGCAIAPADGMISGTDETLVKELGYADGGGLQVSLLGNYTLGGMQVRLLAEGETQTPTKTEYLTGTLSSALDGSGFATVSGVNGALDFSAFPDAKPGDTVFLQCNTYTAPGEGGQVVENIEYIVLLVNANSSGGGEKPTGSGSMPSGSGSMPSGGGGMSFGGGGGGSFSMGGSASSAGDSAETEATLNTTTIASVVPTDEVIVSITVDELDILSLHEGDKALVTIDALPGHSFDGVVTGVNTGRSNNGGNSKYTVEVTLKRSDDMLVGMNASCLVTIETFKGVLSIPAAALCDEVKGPVVYTALDKDGTTLTSPVSVELGISDGERVEILSGLSEGETVWYSVYDTPEYSVPSAGSMPFGSNPGRV